jgi:hypothetical protein
MAATWWTSSTTGARLDDVQLSELRARAHRLFEANPHIFEDELDALCALGAVPLPDLLPGLLEVPSSVPPEWTTRSTTPASPAAVTSVTSVASVASPSEPAYAPLALIA